MASKLTEFLDDHNVRYKTIVHSTTYTAQKTAETVHIKGQEIAKPVIVKVGNEMIMVVVPASRHVDLGIVKAMTGAKLVELAPEAEFRGRFPECEVGAMPPFGNLYQMPVFIDQAITQDKEIAFNACNHNELIQMAYEDFARLVQPKVIAHFASAA